MRKLSRNKRQGGCLGRCVYQAPWELSGDFDIFESLRKVSRKYGSTQLRAPSPLDSKVSKENVSSSTGNGSYSKSSNSECANNIYSSVGNTFVFRIRTAPSYLFVLEVSIGKRGEGHSRWSKISGLNGDNQCRNCAGVELKHSFCCFDRWPYLEKNARAVALRETPRCVIKRERTTFSLSWL